MKNLLKLTLIVLPLVSCKESKVMEGVLNEITG